ncbi:MAG TPA: DUF6531 domain-containing protein [Actinomycetes bacterium]|nr:DUF6531 domain-containing protein [Actinomycetes bacterium]
MTVLRVTRPESREKAPEYSKPQGDARHGRNKNPGGYLGGTAVATDYGQTKRAPEPVELVKPAELSDVLSPPEPILDSLPDGSLSDHGYREVTQARGANWKVFDVDGKYVAEIYSTAIHYQDRLGIWRPIDSNFHATRNGYENGADLIDLRIASKANSDELVRVDLPNDHTIAWQALGAEDANAERNETDHDVVTYRNAWPNADLRITSKSGLVKEEIVLRAADAPRTFRFLVDPDGLDVEATERGIEFSDGKDVVALIPNGLVYEENEEGSAGPAQSSARFAVASRDDGKVIVAVAADPEWLADPARKYPIVIDPTLLESTRLSAQDDTSLFSLAPGDRASLAELSVGRMAAFNVLTTAYMHFCASPGLDPPCAPSGQAPWQGGRVDQATLELTSLGWDSSYSPTGCGTRGLGVYRVAMPWEGHSMTGWPGASVDLSEKKWIETNCDPGVKSWDVTNWVQSWTYNAASNPAPVQDWGLALRVDAVSESDALAFRRFHSADSNIVCCGDWRPKLRVQWSPYGAAYTITGPATLPTTTTPGSIPVSFRNTGQNTWLPTGPTRTFPGYRLWKWNGSAWVFQGVNQAASPVATNVSPGNSINISLPINATGSSGTYLASFDMLTEGGGWYLDSGNPYSASFQFEVVNLGPGGAAAPSDGAIVDDRTPTLSTTYVDPDNSPIAGGQAAFEVYDAPTGGNLVWRSPATGFSAPKSATPTPDKLEWGKTYWWQVGITDGAATLWSTDAGSYGARFALTPQIPPSESRSDTPTVDDVVVADRRLLTGSTDVVVPTLGSQLALERTYTVQSRSETTQARAFGSGWRSLIDARLDTSGTVNGDQKAIFFGPDGTQLTFAKGKDDQYHSEMGATATLTYANGLWSPGIWTLTDAGKTVYQFWNVTGTPLFSITDANGRAIQISPRQGAEQTIADGNGVFNAFNDVDSATNIAFGDHNWWIPVGGSVWGISNNKAYVVSTPNARNVIWTTSGSRDGVIDVTLSTAAGNTGIAFRYL